MRPVANNKQDGVIEHNSWPTSNDWERYKQTIINLYKNSQMKVLIAEMKARHNFRATKRMYETRLWKWGVVKNMKKVDKMKVIKSIQKSSASVGEISAGDWSKVFNGTTPRNHSSHDCFFG
ncbi:hypothetical protein CGMCC3_g16375 [Colletotrichum fructicola]|uniref:Clr5 domain-containing protein n=1 Tax=Colletotrichum fructicola (strain Nara gc5) TaxID=1213859 RepID=A0A7J6JST8_COLFN|nr:uncharacterized protein CGMCC3_g16375 [Colletotrichum fructicola]KAE9567501.1 hypothetical protein CGMCC3_g16375 [Colletotrichum fructicola]KAF4492772.1 hypothetical protein CGGC5_v000195 [Colletotrichum fructicola Nara gc5]